MTFAASLPAASLPGLLDASMLGEWRTYSVRTKLGDQLARRSRPSCLDAVAAIGQQIRVLQLIGFVRHK